MTYTSHHRRLRNALASLGLALAFALMMVSAVAGLATVFDRPDPAPRPSPADLCPDRPVGAGESLYASGRC